MTAKLSTVVAGAAASLLLADAAHAQWSADFGLLYMSRADGDAGVIVEDSVTGDAAIDADDLNDEFGLGGELAIGFKPGPWGGELRGFILEELEGESTFIGNGNGLTILTDPTTGYGLGVGNPFTASLDTELGGVEANLLFDVAPGVELFGGPRYVSLDEEMSLLGDFGGGSTEENIWATDNTLLGAQIGATFDVAAMAGASWPVKPMIRLGAGLYSNDADGDFVVLDDGAVRANSDVSDSSTETAYSFDLDLSLQYAVTGNAMVYAGYRLMYYGDVALAPDQVAGTTSFNVDPTYELRTGDVLFHGVKAGAEIRF